MEILPHVSYLTDMSGSDDHIPAGTHDALKRIADRVALYKKPKYSWIKNYAVRRGALSYLGGDAIGRIFQVEAAVGASPRWRWDLTLKSASRDVQKFHHIGWAASALDAALHVESTYADLGGDRDTDDG